MLLYSTANKFDSSLLRAQVTYLCAKREGGDEIEENNARLKFLVRVEYGLLNSEPIYHGLGILDVFGQTATYFTLKMKTWNNTSSSLSVIL